LKRASIIYLFACSVLAVALFTNVSGASNILAVISNSINGNQDTITAPALMCWVSDVAYSTAVTNVKQSTSSVEYMYWVNYNPGRTIYSLSFIVLFQGVRWGQSPLVYQMQTFSWPSGYSGGTTTPFGVPWWGGNPIIGPAYLIPQVNGEIEWNNYYAFRVVL